MKKLTKKEIEEAWLRKVKIDYPHMSREERLKLLFDLKILKEDKIEEQKSKCNVV